MHGPRWSAQSHQIRSSGSRGRRPRSFIFAPTRVRSVRTHQEYPPPVPSELGARRVDRRRRRSQHCAMLAPQAATHDAIHAEAGVPHAFLSPSTLLQSGATWAVALYGLGELRRRRNRKSVSRAAPPFSRHSTPRRQTASRSMRSRAVESVDRLQGRGASRNHPPRPERLTRAILLAMGADAVASWPSPKSDSLIIRLPDGRLTGRFPVKLTAELAALKLDAFRDQHRLDLSQWTADTIALKPKHGAARAAGKRLSWWSNYPRAIWPEPGNSWSPGACWAGATP